MLMVNLGKNKTADAIPDYVSGVQTFKDVADMMVRAMRGLLGAATDTSRTHHLGKGVSRCCGAF